MRISSLVALLLLGVIGPTLAGCYYGHLASGQTRVLWARKSVRDVLEDPETSAELRAKLLRVQAARTYAAGLGLDVEGQYTSYVPWEGDRIVTSLVVSEPGRVTARPFTFPLIGSVPYKGFFDQARAEAEAETFRRQGMDVCLIAVPAYSTLGFFDDPLTDPMLAGGDGRVVETVIHELVHATVFVKSQPEFNEGVADFIGEEGSIRFFADDPELAEARRSEVADGRMLARVQMELREEITKLYEQELTPGERARQRAELENATRTRLAALSLRTWDAARLAERVRLNDACLALRGAYVSDTPRHALVLESLDGDLVRFVERLRGVAQDDDPRASFFDLRE
ncbi:MAG: aminopeptidase [Deltaproteobacteria bacterium]|nr:aminopeptidase [Deltaproteobacteria bacterium]